ncbi:hypothetical protein [Haliangium sp.]|uniref:hypothetical protein n=1 Tax=Haliangium sp. TaxID=2663208 RepID=UPI003D1020EF
MTATPAGTTTGLAALAAVVAATAVVAASALVAATAATALVAGTIVVAGCGGSQSPYEHIDQRKNEISMLWGQVRDWRQEAGLRGVEPSRRAIVEMHGQPVAKARRACPDPIEPATDECRDTCRLADAICDNAGRICDIAGELAGDAWAADKCASAKASCKEARTACCQCWSEEQRAPPASVPDAAPHEPSQPGPDQLSRQPPRRHW